mgnify:CR=1 FL=1
MWIKRSMWALAALVVLTGAVWLGAPPLMKSQGEARLSEALGRTVTFGRVSLQPWRLQLVVEDIAVAGAAGGAAPLLTIDRLLANVSASSAFRRAPVLEAMELTRPRVRVAHTAAGHYDIDDLITRFTPKPSNEPAGEPARFALYNVRVTDGELRFDDRPAGRVHELKQLQLTLPFLSNLPAQVEVKVEPRLAFLLNGASFDTGAQATPFAQTRSGTLKLGIDRFDLAPYLVYAPKALPVKVVRGVLGSDLEAAFATAPEGQPSVTLRGPREADDVSVATAADAELLGWKSLKVGLADVQPLARKLHFASVDLDGLSVQARRLADGRIDGVPAASASETASAPAPAASAASAVLGKPEPPPWAVKVDAFHLTRGQVAWRDATVAPAAALDLVDVTAKAGPVSHPATAPAPLSASLRIRSAGDKPQDWGTVSIEGEGGTASAAANVTADAIALEALQSYLNAVATPRVAGRLSARARLEWAAGAESPRLRAHVASASLDGLKVTEAGTRLVRAPNVEAIALKQATVADLTVDVAGRSVTVGEVRLQQPALTIQRSDTGVWSAQRWVAGAGVAAQAAAPAASGAATSPPWKVALKSIALQGGRVRVSDAQLATGGKPLLTEVTAIDLGVEHLALEGDKPLPPAAVKLSAMTGTGQVRFNGKVGLAPRQAEGTLALTRLPIHAFAPYAGVTPNVAVARAEAGFKGTVAVRLPGEGVDARVKGDLLLADVLLQTRAEGADAPGDDLVQWQGLALDGLAFEMKPQGKPRLEIDAATLNALQARLVVTEQGRLNLQDAAGTRVGPQGPADAASAPAAAASAPAAAVPASGAARASGNDLPLDVTLTSTRLTNGRIAFSDNFVRPKYSAELTQLDGRLGAIGTSRLQTAELELRGRAAGTADLEISGRVQPLAHPISLDIQARASDLELAPLSPYAAKYVGYAIERGKLTMQVAYRIDPDGRLDATNQVIINQLTFGEKVDSPQATTLPVQLAVSLLTDRHGVIDINLPISGSLDDPEFSVAGMIWKVLGNLMAKAITAPFSLLSGGGRTDISVLPAVPGSPKLTAAGAASIDRVATALTDRPSLRLTITGTSDAASEREAYQRQVLDARLAAERRKETLATGGSAEAAAHLSAADRSRLLRLLYRQADLPDKPRNALGFAKDLPDAEMAARLAARVPVDDDDMRELALQRAVAVRDAIAAKGVAVQRLFLAAPKGKEGDGWVPSVKLTLALE